jgi:hypothetical protein
MLASSSLKLWTFRRHFSRKSSLLSSHTLPPLSSMAGSVLSGGCCRASPTNTTPSSPPSSPSLLFVVAWKCAYRRTLPRPLHLTLSHLFPPLADAQQCAYWRTLPPSLIHFFALASPGCLAVCSLEDAVFINSHPSHISCLSRIWQCLLGNAVSTFAALGAGHYWIRPGLWDEPCSGFPLTPIAKATAEPLR